MVRICKLKRIFASLGIACLIGGYWMGLSSCTTIAQTAECGKKQEAIQTKQKKSPIVNSSGQQDQTKGTEKESDDDG